MLVFQLLTFNISIYSEVACLGSFISFWIFSILIRCKKRHYFSPAELQDLGNQKDLGLVETCNQDVQANVIVSLIET